MSDFINKAVTNLSKRLAIKTAYEKRMPDPSQRVFVYGLNDEAGNLRAADGSRITEYEDPTYLGFHMEIDAPSSPLCTQLPCFMQKYGFHPEMRDRYELLNLFYIELFNYIPFRAGNSLDYILANTENNKSKTFLSKVKGVALGAADALIGIPTNLTSKTSSAMFRQEGKSASDSNAKKSDSNTQQNKGTTSSDLWITEDKLALATDQFYDEKLKKQLRNRVALKRHYITKFEGLSSGRFDPNSEDNKITVDVREDVGLTTSLMAYCYENLVWSARNQRQLIPDNLQEFTLQIYVYEIRNIREFTTALQTASSTIDAIRNFNPKSTVDKFKKLLDKKTDNLIDDALIRETYHVQQVLDVLERCFTLTRYTLQNCKFDFSETSEVKKGLDQAKKTPEEINTSFDISYKRVYKEFFTRLAPKWTSNGVELFWFDNYKNSTIFPVGKTNRRPVSLGSDNASSRLTDLKTQVSNNLSIAAKASVGSIAEKLREDMNIKPIVPANVYRPGMFMDSLVDQIKSNVSGDIQKALLGGIL